MRETRKHKECREIVRQSKSDKKRNTTIEGDSDRRRKKKQNERQSKSDSESKSIS